MPKEIKNMTDNIMSQIKQGKIKMRPRIYYILGSILTFIGLASSVFSSIFLFGLLRFSLRTHMGRGVQLKLETMLSNFPWWIIVLAIISLIIGICLIKKYNFSYKIKPIILILGFILALVVGGWIFDMSGINDSITKKGHMGEILNNYPTYQKAIFQGKNKSFRN
jgi:uncharacterized membrane protein YjjP (DUF1212 family)